MALWAVLAAGIAGSCRKMPEAAEPQKVQEGITLTCVIDDGEESRVAISGQGKTTWEPGDQILVHGKWAGGKYSSTVTLASGDISADGKKATFTVGSYEAGTAAHDDGLSDVYALYPASAAAVDNGATNWRSVGKFNTSNLPLMLGCNTSAGGTEIIFRNVCALISFSVSGNFDTCEFSGNADETVGYDGLQSRFYMKTSGLYSDWVYAGTPLKSLSFPVTADGGTVNYVCIPAGADFEGGFTFKFKKDDSVVKIAKSTTPVSVGRSRLLALGDITPHLRAPSTDESHTSAIDLASATDLGAEQTANCYIVTAPGTYKFKAVQGNGSTSVGTVAGVQLLWETCGSDAAVALNSVISAVDYEGSWICFSTPPSLKAGNALIAACNAAGTILWSWHIWIPQTAVTQDTYGLASHELMDRNLGALVAAPSSGTVPAQAYGLLYQWGRKDPFIGSGGGNSAAAFAGTAMTKKGGQLSLDESVKGPTVYGDAGSNTNWCTSPNADFWGDKNGSKTVYDPCPPGYKVPLREDATGLFKTDLTGTASFTYDSANHRFTAGDPLAVFPLCGYLETNGGYSHCGDRGFVWNAHYDSSYSYAAYSQYVYEGPKSATYSQSVARAGSVRCLSEKEVEFHNADGMPVQGSYTRTVFDSSIQELSGLCFSKDGDFIWGVGDEGDIFKITLDMNVSIYKSTGSDLEDVTLDPNTGDLYFAKEADRVDKMAAPAYSSKTVAFYVADAANFGNSGLEGIAWYKDNSLYVGAQTGATLWKYSLDGTLIWKKQLGTIAPMIQEVGGLCYDSAGDWLWVTDSEACKLFVFDGAVTRLLAVYDVSFIGNAESVLVDRERGCVYVGDDGSTSKIYRIAFSGF